MDPGSRKAGAGDHFGGQGKQPPKNMKIGSYNELRVPGVGLPLRELKIQAIAGLATGRLADPTGT